MKESITAVRMLAVQAIQKAKSGHPGLALGAAPAVCTVFEQMRHSPANPKWMGRDRFVLSAGHASAMLYSILHLYGYGITMEDMKNFRQLNSKTPGHPEYGIVPGVEATTGPLGQGFAMAVGMAMAEKHQAAVFNKEGYPVFDNYTYVVMGDGCMMEGIVQEAASLAGSLKLGKLIALYDSNRITIEGNTDITFTENTFARFEALGWHVQEVSDGEDTEAVRAAICKAKQVSDKPSLIIVHTEIGYGSPRQGTPKAHGEPLGEENVQATADFFGWKEPAFTVPERVYAEYKQRAAAGAAAEAAWQKMFAEYSEKYPELAARLENAEVTRISDFINNPGFWEFPASEASRISSGTVINRLAAALPAFMGGSADLSPSNKTEIKGEAYLSPETPEGRNIHFGVREFAMAAACNGMALYGGIIPYCATFFVFSDYVKPAMRLSALMGLRVIFVLTHDSIGVGEDGPTHQPVEQLAMLRAIPGVNVFRPADGKECAAGYLSALQHNGPSVMVLSRQNLEKLEASGPEAMKGAYIVRDMEKAPDVLLMSSGSEVSLAMSAAELLKEKGIAARVVSMPSFFLYEAQDSAYKKAVLPENVRARVAVEAASSFGWGKYIGLDGQTVALDSFGASGPYKEVYQHFGFTPEAVADAALRAVAAVQ